MPEIDFGTVFPLLLQGLAMGPAGIALMAASGLTLVVLALTRFGHLVHPIFTSKGAKLLLPFLASLGGVIAMALSGGLTLTLPVILNAVGLAFMASGIFSHGKNGVEWVVARLRPKPAPGPTLRPVLVVPPADDSAPDA